jgi:hypothetical protein
VRARRRAPYDSTQLEVVKMMNSGGNRFDQHRAVSDQQDFFRGVDCTEAIKQWSFAVIKTAIGVPHRLEFTSAFVGQNPQRTAIRTALPAN